MQISRSLQWTFLTMLPCLVFGGLCFSATAFAGVGNFCPIGDCVINNPVYINLYWDSSPSQWDTDVSATTSGEGHQRLDAFVRALAKSGYFRPMSAPYKVFSARTRASITSACAPIPANVDDSFDKVKNLVQCVLNANPSLNNESTVFNVFLPPQVKNTGFCDKDEHGNHSTAKHDKFGSPVEITINPTNSACNSNFNNLVNTLSHEMVEAATDPIPLSPTGFKVFVLGDKGGNEIGDLCENTSTPFLFGSLTQYWSNPANKCITGVSLKAPKISSVKVCGSGGAMTIKLSGNFGAEPWDLPNDFFHGQTLYLKAAVTGSSSWGAGNIEGVPPDAVGFGFIDWQQGENTDPDTITINGFDSKYGSPGHQLLPGDTVTFSVFSPDTGQSSNALGGVSTSPKKVAIVVYGDSPVYVNSSGRVAGLVSDGSGCGIGNVPVTLSATEGTLAATATTIAGGEFTAHYAAPSVAGKVKINAATAPAATKTAMVPVYPRLDSLSRKFGSVSGNQQITLKGAGFDNSTVIKFSEVYKGSAKVTVNSVGPEHKNVMLTTPKSFLPGDGTGTVAVTATVNGVHSEEVLEYTYILAGKPVIDTSALCGTGQGKLTVTAYNDDGSIDAVSLNLSANYPAFAHQTSNTATIQSGATIDAHRGGVITATNPATLASSNVIFECLKVNVPAGAPSQQFQLQAGPECTGDCGGLPGNIAVWTRQEANVSGADSVTISGRPSEELSQTYNVRGVGVNELQRLTSGIAQVTIGQRAIKNAEFLGPAVEIQRADGTESAPIKENNQIALDLPTDATSNGNYTIVHLDKPGDAFVWTGVSGTSYLPDKGVVRGQASMTGVYALVSLPAPEIKTAR